MKRFILFVLMLGALGIVAACGSAGPSPEAGQNLYPSRSQIAPPCRYRKRNLWPGALYIACGN